ncbi:hypothetical protein D3C76_1219700 [compost metagenome]
MIRGAQGKTIPREFDGGKVVSWSRGHDLAAMDALESFVTAIAGGELDDLEEIQTGAERALELMRRRSSIGWDADAKQEGKQ